MLLWCLPLKKSFDNVATDPTLQANLILRTKACVVGPENRTKHDLADIGEEGGRGLVQEIDALLRGGEEGAEKFSTSGA